MKKITALFITALLLLQIVCLVSCTDESIPPKNDDTSILDIIEDIPSPSPEEEAFLHRHDNVPEEYKEHALITAKQSGDLRALTGDVLVTFIFTNDSTSSWDENTIPEFTSQLEAELQKLSGEAAAYGAEVTFRTQTKTATVDFEIDKLDSSTNWEEQVISMAGLPDIETVNVDIASENGAASAPVIFLLNKEKRSYAHRSTNTETSSEYAIVYEVSALRHEILHLYGAEDFYYPKSVMEAAKEFLPDSVMLDSTKDVDSFTAFLVGWTESPDQTALDFFAATKDVTQEAISAALKDESFTGNATREMATGTYTGDLVDGVAEGYGKMLFINGDVYEGYWKNNKKHGEGKLTWACGHVYEGTWVRDTQEGKGKFTWTNGDVYEGNWQNGKMNGKGKITWANGNIYEGDWLDDNRTGYGKFTWATGSVYEGDWVNNDQCGRGKFTWTDGSIYDGEFKDGDFNGYGVYVWPDGSKYEGNYANGKRHGKGTYSYPGGTYYTGDWENGSKTGYGTFVWSNGDKYEGQWLNDQRHGQGKYTFADGTVNEGTFENDKFIG